MSLHAQHPDRELRLALTDPRQKERAFRELVDTYGPRLHAHILRMVHLSADADDVLQNTLVKAYRGMEKYRGDSKLYTWLYRIASNESLNWLDKRRRRLSVTPEQEGNWVDEKLRAEPYFDGDEAQRKLQAAIAGLPDKQRLVFNLRYFDEMPYQEMSDTLGTSVGGLKASYHLAAKKISAQLLQNE
ncbi:RNA polymerase subunit sigma-70 [Lewinellaceae bacterium SD302]|nr:RNA polymerase subunit sigma-70 [Lewinellaceae bacterium SD302]